MRENLAYTFFFLIDQIRRYFLLRARFLQSTWKYNVTLMKKRRIITSSIHESRANATRKKTVITAVEGPDVSSGVPRRSKTPSFIC